MLLLTKENRAKLPALYSQENTDDPLVQVKFFYGGSTWGATEFDPKEDLFFGWATHGNGGAELGYFSLAELESFRGRFGGIERDRYFEPIPLSQFKQEYP